MSDRRDSLPRLIYNIKDTCTILMVCRTTLWKLVKTNRLQCTRIGKRVFFTLKQLTDFLDAQAQLTLGATRRAARRTARKVNWRSFKREAAN